MAKLAKCGKRVNNVDDVDKVRMVLGKHVGGKIIGEELSPMDPNKAICSVWTRKGEIRSTGLLLSHFQ